jgi:hypothetical protein
MTGETKKRWCTGFEILGHNVKDFELFEAVKAGKLTPYNAEGKKVFDYNKLPKRRKTIEEIKKEVKNTPRKISQCPPPAEEIGENQKGRMGSRKDSKTHKTPKAEEIYISAKAEQIYKYDKPEISDIPKNCEVEWLGFNLNNIKKYNYKGDEVRVYFHELKLETVGNAIPESNKEKTPHKSIEQSLTTQSKSTNDHETFIRSMQISFVSNTEIKIKSGNKKSRVFNQKELGFQKNNSNIWNALIEILKTSDHFYRVGKARGTGKIRKTSYDVNQKILAGINKKIITFLNKQYDAQLPDNFKVYELVPEGQEAPGIYKLKFQICNLDSLKENDYKDYSKEKLLSEIKKLSSESAKLSSKGDEVSGQKENEKRSQLNSAITIACEKNWLTQNQARTYLHTKQEEDNVFPYCDDVYEKPDSVI